MFAMGPGFFTGVAMGMYKAHKYWRIRFTANQGSGFFLAQGQSGFSLTAGGSFVIPDNVGATSQDFEPATGFFQVTARWSTNWGSGQTLTAEYVTPKAIAELRMLGNASFPDRTAKDFTVEWSDDGSAWNATGTFTNQDLTTNTYKSYLIGDPV